MDYILKKIEKEMKYENCKNEFVSIGRIKTFASFKHILTYGKNTDKEMLLNLIDTSMDKLTGDFKLLYEEYLENLKVIDGFYRD